MALNLKNIRQLYGNLKVKIVHMLPAILFKHTKEYKSFITSIKLDYVLIEVHDKKQKIALRDFVKNNPRSSISNMKSYVKSLNLSK